MRKGKAFWAKRTARGKVGREKTSEVTNRGQASRKSGKQARPGSIGPVPTGSTCPVDKVAAPE